MAGDHRAALARSGGWGLAHSIWHVGSGKLLWVKNGCTQRGTHSMEKLGNMETGTTCFHLHCTQHGNMGQK